MTFREDTHISPYLLLPLLFALWMGYGLLHIPRFGAYEVGADGYLCVLLAAIMAVPSVLACFDLRARFPGQTVIEFAPRIIGKIPATILNTVFLLFLLVFAALILRDVGSMAFTYLLDRSPLWAILLSILVGVVYLAYHGVESTARLSSFIFILGALLLVILFLIGYSDIDLRLVRPILSSPPLLYLRYSAEMTYIYLPLVYLLILVRFVRDPKPALQMTLWGLALATFVFFIKTFGMMATFGPSGINRYTWPVMEYVHVVEVPILLLEQVWLVLMIVWFVKTFAALTTSFWALAYSFSRLVPKAGYKKWALILGPVMFGLALLPRHIVQTREITTVLIRYGGIPVSLYPVFLWLVAAIFGKRGASRETV